MIDERVLFEKLGMRVPGRLVLLARDVRADQIEAAAEALVDHMIIIYERSQSRIRQAFLRFAEIPGVSDIGAVKRLADEMFNAVKDCTYPYLYIDAANIENVNEHDHLLAGTIGAAQSRAGAYSRILRTRSYYSEFTEPTLFRQYLIEELRFLLERGYAVEAGQSLNPIPVLYAVERGEGGKIQSKQMARLLRVVFPVPDVAQVEDGIVDSIDVLNPSHLINHDRFQHFPSMFWTRFFDHLNKSTFMASIEGLPALHDVHGRVGGLDLTQLGLSFFASCFVPGARGRVSAGKDDPCIEPIRGASAPLSLYPALRTDFSLVRLIHYTLTEPSDFQDHVLFTNYGNYMRTFIELACANLLLGGEGAALTLSYRNDGSFRPGTAGGQVVTGRKGLTFSAEHIEAYFAGDQAARQALIDGANKAALDSDPPPPPHPKVKILIDEIVNYLHDSCQMPTLHYKSGRTFEPPATSGSEAQQYFAELVQAGFMPSVTIVNIGVGPSNAKTATDHIAVLRPQTWMMVGHCAGVRQRQELGHYVIADACVRDDHVLDRLVPPSVPVRFSSYIRDALNQSVFALLSGDVEPDGEDPAQAAREGIEDVKRRVRTGAVFTTADRNWELWSEDQVRKILDAGRIAAVDMETATIAANGFRHRVHAGALLCISDKPLHGAMKMRFFADEIYNKQVRRHLRVAINAVLFMQVSFAVKFLIRHSREFSSPNNPPFS